MIDYLAEQLAPLGTIRTKKMFGEQCLFLNGQMLAIIHDNDVYIKKININDNDIRFGYLRKDKMIYMNYVLIDNSIIDDQDELIQLVRSYIFV